jgi:phosphatidate cytidylyltransferase
LNNFFKRSLTGIVFVLVLGGGILINSFTFFALIGVIIGLGLWEFYKLMAPTQLSANKLPGLTIGLLFFCLICLYSIGYIEINLFWVIVPLISVVFVLELYRKHDYPFQNIAITLFGVLYVVVPLSLLVLIGFPERSVSGYESKVIMGFFFLLWSNDTGAYLTGISIGKHPMFPRISPKKSWEGFTGGLVFTLLVAFIISKYFTELQRMDWMIIAVIICIFGVWGDLIESMLKRSLQIKDSGNILPGHGGILDRFDSVLFSAPIVFVYLQLKNLMLF